jgi:hypothetical protein
LPRRPAARRERSRARRSSRAARWRRWLRAYRRARPPLRIAIGVAGLAVLWAAANGIYQAVHKPTELFFPVSAALDKRPSETWDAYASIFRRHATDAITAEFLAALAQVEGSGNPITRTYWRWSWRPSPFEVYRPASSAVGMYQITDGTFAEARRYCIRDHSVAEEGAWHDWRSCWFNSLYFRVVPSHAVELTSAYLDRRVASALARHRVRSATLAQKQRLAALIHLCGAGAGERYAPRVLGALGELRCGDHDAGAYLARVEAMVRVFAALAERE